MSASGSSDAEALMRRVRTVLLDFDGPVCSIFAGYPAPDVTVELAATAGTAGHPVPGEYLRNQDPLDILRFAGTVGSELTSLIERELTAAELKAAETAEATPGAGDFLTACQSTGRVVAVVSNNSAAAVKKYLDRIGWTDLVHLVEGRDPFDPALMKPHPHVLLRTLAQLAAPAESAVIVGDSVTDIEAGLAADVWTIGYANKPGKDEAMRDAGADALISNMNASLPSLVAPRCPKSYGIGGAFCPSIRDRAGGHANSLPVAPHPVAVRIGYGSKWRRRRRRQADNRRK